MILKEILILSAHLQYKSVSYSEATCTYFELVDGAKRLKEAGQEFLVDIVVKTVNKYRLHGG